MKRYIRASYEDKLYGLTERHVNAYLESVSSDDFTYDHMVDYVADMVTYNLKEKYGYKNLDTSKVYKQVAMIIDAYWDEWVIWVNFDS